MQHMFPLTYKRWLGFKGSMRITFVAAMHDRFLLSGCITYSLKKNHLQKSIKGKTSNSEYRRC